MTEKIKERHNKMTHDMYEEKEHYKMYKSGDHWVSAKIATIAGVALFSTAILGAGNQASADTVNSNTPSAAQVASSKTSSATAKSAQPMRLAATPQSSSSNKGMNVDVPHGDLDNAVSNAKKDGVQVSQGATTQTTADANKAPQAESSIANDYKNQTDAMNKADAQQKQVNSAKATANDHSAVDSAAKQAQSVGVQVSKGSDQSIKGNPEDASKVQSQISNDYNSQVKSLQDATNQQKQVNSAKATANDHTAVDNAVKQAQAAGVSVNKDSDKTISGNASDAQKIQGQISGDYNSEVQDIQNAINQQKQYDQAYQTAMDQYNQALADYNKKKAAYEATVSQNNQIKDNSINVAWSYDNASNPGSDYAKIQVDVLNNSGKLTYEPRSQFTGTDKEWESTAAGKWTITMPAGQHNGDLARVTYTDLSPKFTIGGKHVGKIVVTFSDLQAPNLTSGNAGNTAGLSFYNDPLFGFWYNNSSGVHANYQFYLDGSNTPYNFNDQYSVWSVQSLDHYQSNGHTETVTLTTDGHPYPIANSDIQYSGNTATPVKPNFNDKNQPINPDGSIDHSNGSNTSNHTARFFIGGSTVGLTFSTKNNAPDNPSTLVLPWSSQLPLNPVPTSPGNPPTPPKKQQASVSYHYDVANIAPVQASYHYDVADVPNVQASYHYDGLNITPVETKDVAAGTIQGNSSVSINGKDVVQGQDLTFTLNTTDLPAGRKEDMKSYQAVDKLDPNFDYTGYRAYLGSTDVTDEFTPTLTKDANGQWTLTLTANSALLSAMNKDKSKAFTVPTIDIYGKAIKGGTTIKNSYVEKINNDSWTSNTVTVNTEKPGTPVKIVDNADGQDANNGNVARGDALIYHVSMDLTNQSKDTVLTPDTIAKGLWDTDKMPNGVTVNTEGIRVNSADGKDITSQFTITDEGGQIKVAAKDPAAIIKEYGGTKLDITIPTTVDDDFTGDITNTAQQNTFGITTDSNTVVDHVPPMNPTKDVIANLSDPSSLNGKSITLGSYFDYDLNSSTRSADYVGKTTEWGMQDHLDTQHDEFTGQWQVIADHPFVLQDGTTIKAGSDISKYFTMTYNTKTGEIDFEANKDFLDIMNLPANKKTAQGWTALFQCKRIAPGTVYNTFSETYNGRVKKSNTVKTTTPEPKKPEPSTKKPVTPVQPAKPAPAVAKAQPKATPAAPVLATPAPVKATPAPEKQAMPQTGEEENNEAALVGFAALGMVGMMGLGLRKKRYDD